MKQLIKGSIPHLLKMCNICPELQFERGRLSNRLTFLNLWRDVWCNNESTLREHKNNEFGNDSNDDHNDFNQHKME